MEASMHRYPTSIIDTLIEIAYPPKRKVRLTEKVKRGVEYLKCEDVTVEEWYDGEVGDTGTIVDDGVGEIEWDQYYDEDITVKTEWI